MLLSYLLLTSPRKQKKIIRVPLHELHEIPNSWQLYIYSRREKGRKKNYKYTHICLVPYSNFLIPRPLLPTTNPLLLLFHLFSLPVNYSPSYLFSPPYLTTYVLIPSPTPPTALPFLHIPYVARSLY